MQVYQERTKKSEGMMSIDEFRISRCKKYGDAGWFIKTIRWIIKFFRG